MKTIVWACSVVLCAVFVVSCYCTVFPSIHATTDGSTITIDGQGFKDVQKCAHLVAIGLKNPVVAKAGDPDCKAGTFKGQQWAPQPVGCSGPMTQKKIVIMAIGDADVKPASDDTTLNWNDTCGIKGQCGLAGQPACGSEGCRGSTVQQGDSCVACGQQDGDPICAGPVPCPLPHLVARGDVCIACGGDGQPVCPTTPACLPGLTAVDGVCRAAPGCGGEGQAPCTQAGTPPCNAGLNQNYINHKTICTFNCGHAQGSKCPSSGSYPGCAQPGGTLQVPQNACITQKKTSNGGQSLVYTCYDYSQLPKQSNAAQCICDTTTQNPQHCKSDTSDVSGSGDPSGLCIHNHYNDCDNP